MVRKTKIVATIGPATDHPVMLEKMIKAGMNVARLNFSHGDYKEFVGIIKNIRSISKKLKKNVAILQDLQGLKIRIGELNTSPMTLKTGEEVYFTVARNHENNEIPVQYEGFIQDVKVGERVLVADGRVQLIVLKKEEQRVLLRVIHGGEIANHKGINIPDTSVAASPITAKDKKDIAFGIQHGVDFIALSFVKDRKDILELKDLIRRHKGHAKVIAKIERKEALDHLEEIIHASDAIMVARGDLGVELSFEKVPLIQKRIIALANKHGKPVITATQMLMSMIQGPVPTRAEVSDIANAILDQTDAIMLSDETAIGKYPVQAVTVMHKTALEVEAGFVPKRIDWEEVSDDPRRAAPIAMAFHGIRIANDLHAKYIIIFTHSGFSAFQVSRFHPKIPLVVFTQHEEVKRQLALGYGINEVYVMKTFDHTFKQAISFLINEKKLKTGDNIVIVSAGKKLKEGVIDEIRVFTVD
jgi:pyruvate kinase